MTLMSQLPNSVEDVLREAARRQQVAPEELAVQILDEILRYDLREPLQLNSSESLE